MKKIRLFLVAMLFLFAGSCSSSSNTVGPDNIIRSDGKIFIVDRTGKQWDVTHAENEYGLEADQFQFGLGPFAIRPIMNPRFVDSSASAFPNINSGFLVIGVDMNGQKRAYPISVLSRHEVATEKFGNAHVSVAY